MLRQRTLIKIYVKRMFVIARHGCFLGTLAQNGVCRFGNGTGIRVRLGCLQELVDASRGLWWGVGGQPQVAQHLDDHRGICNGRDEREGAAALWAGGPTTVGVAILWTRLNL